MSEVVKIKKNGLFYNCYGNSAIIIYYISNYKYIYSKNMIGFTEYGYKRMIYRLEQEKISYEVYDNHKIITNKYYSNDNYKNTLNKGIEKLLLDKIYIEKILSSTKT